MITPDINISYYQKTSKPFIRWWWFANPIEKKEISRQLTWTKTMGFGGVEIAWVYPLQQSPTTVKFLSREWAELVAHARTECLRLDLVCDFTLGTLWPFGGSFVSDEMASHTCNGLSEQQLQDSWEAAYSKTPGRVLNHLNRKALEEYVNIILQGLQPALALNTTDLQTAGTSVGPCASTDAGDQNFHNIPALFCDSWEVAPEGLWTAGFGETFYQRFGYHIEALMNELDAHPAERYDYCVLRAEYILKEFFQPFTEICHSHGALSRVQAHGAPLDLLSAYATADIPESEALLFDPEFSYLAASAAVLAERPVVTCETFSCLYGWKPRPERGQFLKQEKTSDLKLLADALFACGVNHIIWHGMPYNPEGSGNEFYASVHVGPDGSLANDLQDFNRYLETISLAMKTGSPLTELAVYLPIEDMFMQGKLPQKMRKPSSDYYWELQDLRWSKKLDGYHPTWVSAPFVQTASVVKSCVPNKEYSKPPLIRIGQARFSALVVDAHWLDIDALTSLVNLAEQGALLFIPNEFSEPGRAVHECYYELLKTLISLPTVYKGPDVLAPHVLSRQLPPLLISLDGEQLPLYRIRRSGNTLRCFFAHPGASGLTYPLPYDHAQTLPHIVRHIRFRIDLLTGQTKPEDLRYLDLMLEFAPNQSLLLDIDTSTAGPPAYRLLDIAYTPSS